MQHKRNDESLQAVLLHVAFNYIHENEPRIQLWKYCNFRMHSSCTTCQNKRSNFLTLAFYEQAAGGGNLFILLMLDEERRAKRASDKSNRDGNDR